jgi:sortase A
LIIPAIDLDAPVEPVSWTLVTRGDTTEAVWDVASQAVGWHLSSAIPGQAGNIVLAGHHNIDGMVFQHLYRLKAGDEIRLIAGPVAHTYWVEEVMIVPETGISDEQRDENARWIGAFPDERLTLVSCWPADNNTHRVIVVAFPYPRSEQP